MLNKKALTLIPVLGSALLLTACFHNDDDDNMSMEMVRYQVEITNLTNNQPLSPPALVAHKVGYTPWTIGSAASVGLEKLAEGGDTTDFVMEAEANNMVYDVMAASSPVAPGATASFTLETSPGKDMLLTVATMLVNTNDAFTGTSGSNIGMLGAGMTHTLYTQVYDAGTEDNSETAATMPGPAGGGEGFNAARETADRVSMHGGVVTADDGLATSALDESHRFDNPAAKIVITRL